jgi:hypothetical protein
LPSIIAAISAWSNELSLRSGIALVFQDGPACRTGPESALTTKTTMLEC